MEHAFIEIPFIRGSIFCGSHGRKLIAFGHQFIEFFNNYEIQKYCLSIVSTGFRQFDQIFIFDK